MNSAKRVSTQTIKKNEKDEKKVAPAENAGNKKVILFSCLGLIIAAIIFMVCWENHHPRVIFTVNGEKTYLGDMMTDIYMTESTGQYMDSLYKQNYGATASYWNAETDDGQTYGELLKDNTLEAAMQRAMLYNEAVAAGFTLSEEDNANCEESATSTFDQLTAAVRNKTGLTKEAILAYYQKKTLADNYKASWIDTFEIDDEALIKEAGINETDYRQYDIQYYYIPYGKQAEDGSQTTMTDAEKKAAVEELEASYKDIAGLKDFTTYINSSTETPAEGEEAEATKDEGPKAPEGTNIKYSTKSFIEKDEDVFGDDLIKEIKKMDNNSITDGVVEDENGCYIIKMVENNSKESYESECEAVVTEEENKVFQEKIEELEVDKYFIEVNDKEWDKVEFGKVTIN